MKKLFACLLALSLLCTLTACVKEEMPEEPAPKLTTASRDTGSTSAQDDTTTSTEETSTTHTGMSEESALRIAEQAVEAYSTYGMFLLCCDLEYVEGDFSAFLTEQQKEVYFQCQYKITCCRTPEQVTKHVHRHLSPSIATASAADMLFTDNQGALYLLVIPMGGYVLSDVRLLEYTDSRILATAAEYGHGEDGAIARYHFTLEKSGGNFVITHVSYTSLV